MILLLLLLASSFEQAVDAALPSYSLEEAGEQATPAFKAMGWAVVGAAATDLASTQYVLSGGGHETNPLVPKDIKGIAAVKVATTVGVLWLTEEIRKSGHGKTALWIRVATVAVWGYATAHNLRMGSQLR